MRRLFSVRDREGSVVCAHCRVADTYFSRMRGLLGRKPLAGDEGLLLTPCSSVHTMFMSYPLDLVFLESDLTVVGLRENVRPWRMAGWFGARYVLELPAGTCESRRIRPGDKLGLDEDGANGAEENASVLLLLRNGDESQIVVGHGPLSAAGRTISAMEELDVGVSAVVLRDDED
jgi:uncharacterized protein